MDLSHVTYYSFISVSDPDKNQPYADEVWWEKRQHIIMHGREQEDEVKGSEGEAERNKGDFACNDPGGRCIYPFPPSQIAPFRRTVRSALHVKFAPIKPHRPTDRPSMQLKDALIK